MPPYLQKLSNSCVQFCRFAPQLFCSPDKIKFFEFPVINEMAVAAKYKNTTSQSFCHCCHKSLPSPHEFLEISSLSFQKSQTMRMTNILRPQQKERLESVADKKYFEISVRLIVLFGSPPF